MDKIYIWKVQTLKQEWKYWELVSISFWPQDFDKFENQKIKIDGLLLIWKTRKDWGKYLEVFVRDSKPEAPKYDNKDIPF